MISGYAFSPTPDTVAINTTVSWMNQDSPIAHTATSDASSAEMWDTGQLTSNTASHKFTMIGTFKYHCSNHPTMFGTIVVK